METTLKSSLRNVVKFYDIFTYPACKQYEMKKKEKFLSDCLLYFSHAIWGTSLLLIAVLYVM